MEVEDKPDRWSMGWPEDDEPPWSPDILGYHTAKRYRNFRHVIEDLEYKEMNQERFGTLLSADSMRDELSVYKKETSLLATLAQTGHFVRQLRRLHSVLDAAALAYEMDEPAELCQWEEQLNIERLVRAAWFDVELSPSCYADTVRREVSNDSKAVEIMTLLKAAINKYGPTGTSELIECELCVMKRAFNAVAELSGIVIMTLPSWFALPFEFGASFGLSTWGNGRYIPNYTDTERFVKEASRWAAFNHPHVAKFLGACHVGSEFFIAHEEVRTLAQYASRPGRTRAMVWKRFHEVGLALQYAHENGFRCPALRPGDIFCAQHEDRAVLFGSYLLGTELGLLDLPNINNSETLAVNPLFESLMNSIETVFASMAEAIYRYSAPQQRIKLLQTRHMTTAPREIYPSIEDKEWLVLMKMKNNSGEKLLHVVETLSELTEVPEGCDWSHYVPVLLDQLGSTTRRITIDEIIVPLQCETVGAILQRCRSELLDSDASQQRVLRRFENVCSQLQGKSCGLIGWLSCHEAVAHMCKLLGQFSEFTGTSSRISQQSYSAGGILSSTDICVPTSYRDPGRIYSLHSRLDRLLVMHDLLTSDHVHNWVDEWRRQYPEFGTQSRPTLIDALVSRENTQHLQWAIPREQIDFDQLNAFSEGAFGSVHKGKWFQTPVIVKRVKQHTTTETQFRQEADVWFQLNHINVVKMYGACDIGDLFFVCEYASGGDLDKYLDSKGRDPYLMWYCLLNAALGLQYLHNNGIVHADLKANNILVGSDGVAKLTDFGLSVRAKDPSGASAGALGAYQWKAPECLNGSVATFASDVYSFAMVMIEVMSGSCPWGNGTEDVYVKVQVKKGLLPPRPSSIGDSEWGLIERMCAQDPTRRVTMDTVVVSLSSVLQRLDHDKLWKSGVYNPTAPKNRVFARAGILLSLTELVRCKNRVIADHAANQIISVSHGRDSPSEEREIREVLVLLSSDNEQEKRIGASAVSALAEENLSILSSKYVVSQLVAMVKSVSADLKIHAANALANMSARFDISEAVLSAQGIDPLLSMMRSETIAQQKQAIMTIANMSSRADITSDVLAGQGIEILFRFVGNCNVFMKNTAALAIAALTGHCDLSEAVIAVGGIELLVQLVNSGTDDQKHAAAMALSNMTVHADISDSVLAECGINPLVQLVKDGTDDQKYVASLALAGLSDRSKYVRYAILAANGIEVLHKLLCKGTGDHKYYAALALATLSQSIDISKRVQDFRLVNPLTLLLRDGTDREKMQAAIILANLAARADICDLVVAAQGIDQLFKLVDGEAREQKHAAIMALANLCVHKNISKAILAMDCISSILKVLRDTNDDTKEQATIMLANLSTHADITAVMVDSGGILALMEIVRNGTEAQKKNATRALSNLSRHGDISRDVLVSNGIGPVLNMLKENEEDIKSAVVILLASLAIHTDISEPMLGSRGIEALVHFMRDGSDDQKELAAMTLAKMPGHKIADVVVDTQGIGPLLELVFRGNHKQHIIGTFTLRNLSDHPRVSDEVLALCGIEALVDLLSSKNEDLTSVVAMILRNISCRSSMNENAVANYVEFEVLPQIRAGSDEKRTGSIIRLANLSNCADISDSIDVEGIAILVTLMKSGTDTQKYAAATILVNISQHSDVSTAVHDVGGIEALVELVRGGTENQKTQGVWALANMLNKADISEAVISANGVRLLLQMLQNGTTLQRTKAVRAVADMLSWADISEGVLAANGIDSLIILIRDGSADQKYAGALAISNLAERADISEQILAVDGIAILRQLERDGVEAQRQVAASAITSLARHSTIAEAMDTLV